MDQKRSGLGRVLLLVSARIAQDAAATQAPPGW